MLFAALACSLQLGIELSLFLGAAFLGIFISTTFTIRNTMVIHNSTITEVEYDQKTYQAW